MMMSRETRRGKMVKAPVTFCNEFVRRLPFERQGTYTELQW